MDKLPEFIANHPLLVAGTAAVIAAIIANEIYQLLTGRRAIDPSTATRLFNREDAVFIDLRGENAYHTTHLPSAINLPEEQIGNRLDRLERFKGRPAVVYGDGVRGLGRILERIEGSGLAPVYQLRGGIQSWQEANLPTEGRN